MKNYPFSGCLQGRLGGDGGLSLGQGETLLAGEIVILISLKLTSLRPFWEGKVHVHVALTEGHRSFFSVGVDCLAKLLIILSFPQPAVQSEERD